MQYECRVCGKHYEYTDEQGYDKELCGPMCDGKEQGGRFVMRKRVRPAIDELTRGCTVYDRWYAGGEPEMNGYAMAYEMVSFMRLAISKLEEDSECDGASQP